MGLVLRFDPDPDFWIAVPYEWPTEDWASPEDWGSDVCALLLENREAGELVGVDDYESLLTEAVVALARSRVDYPADGTYVYHPDLPFAFTTVDIAIFPAEGNADARHRALGRVDAPDAVGVVEVESFVTGGLGHGTRVLRFDRQAEDAGASEVVASLRYFWRVGDAADVAVNVVAANILDLVERMPAVEALLETAEVASSS